MTETTKIKISLETAQLIYNAYSEGYDDGAGDYGGEGLDKDGAYNYAENMKKYFDFDGDIELGDFWDGEENS